MFAIVLYKKNNSLKLLSEIFCCFCKSLKDEEISTWN
jgi:hypothetical protein